MTRPWLARFLVLVTLAGAGACTVETPAGGAAGRAGADAPPPATARPRPELVPAGAGNVDAVVRQALTAATAEGRRLVVYVGASWCEPCEAFHLAVERGELDQALAGVRFLEFDADRDGARLEAAGYGGRLIPRFVLPGADGHGSAQRMEGGIKGEGAVHNIMGRLGPLLAGTRGAALP
jgi:thiol-disulfide isomerase/thioredoxin